MYMSGKRLEQRHHPTNAHKETQPDRTRLAALSDAFVTQNIYIHRLSFVVRLICLYLL